MSIHIINSIDVLPAAQLLAPAPVHRGVPKGAGSAPADAGDQGQPWQRASASSVISGCHGIS